jgi:hypothetical protein
MPAARPDFSQFAALTPKDRTKAFSRLAPIRLETRPCAQRLSPRHKPGIGQAERAAFQDTP